MSDLLTDMTRKELEILIAEKTLSGRDMRVIVKEAVQETLVQMGLDTSNPIDMQRDFQHLRDWRIAQEALRQKGAFVMVSIIVTGVASLLWIGFKSFINQ